MSNPARATLADLNDLGLKPEAFVNVTAARRQRALNAASDLLDGYLAAQFDPPFFPPWPQDVIWFECVVASYLLLTNRGYNPSAGPADENVRREYEARIEWAKQVAAEEITPAIIDSSFDQAAGGSFVTSSTTRGYSERGLGGRPPSNIQADPFSDD